jgi:putative ABC transport system permease protein
VFFQSTLEFSAGRVTVQQSGAGGFQTGFSGSDITDEQLELMEGIDGVKDVVPVNMYVESGFGFGAIELVVVGIDPSKGDIFVGEGIGLYSGRELESDDTGFIMVGKDFADDRNLVVGDSVTVKDTDFEVLGILEKSNNINVDGSAMITISDMQEILDTEDYQLVYVIPEDVRDVEIIAERIEDEDENLAATTDKDFARTASEVVGQIRLFMFAMGGIAAIIGGLGVLNTMVMAVLERRKEIGVMKAIGATRFRVLMQIMTESVMISLIGGAMGVFLGWLASVGLRIVTEDAIPATVTPELAGIGILFAIFLGAVGGLYPAWQASRLDPVEALRYE